MTEEDDNQETPGSETSEQADSPRSDKDEALEERKRELEAELDRYAQAGAYSPGLVKISRWVSRFLYFIMAAAVIFLLFNQKKYDDEDMQKAVDRAQEFKDKLDAERDSRKEAESRLAEAEMRAAMLKLDMEELLQGPPAADRAQQEARSLVERYRGEQAYTPHWRETLDNAEPEAHGPDPVGGARSLIEQASHAPAAQRYELLREVADFGREGVTEAVLHLLHNDDPAVAETSAKVAGWLGGESIREWALAAVKETDASETALLYSLQTQQAPPPGAAQYMPEAWVGYAMRAYNVAQTELAEAYRNAPEERRLELIALLAETGGASEVELFRSVATSSRPPAERIVAVRWMGDKGGAATKDLLQSLSEGQGVIAEEARKALERQDG